MVSQRGKDETLGTDLDEIQTDHETAVGINAVVAAGINASVVAAVGKLLKQLLKPLLSSSVLPLEPVVPPSGKNQLHADRPPIIHQYSRKKKKQGATARAKENSL